ncbi:MAG: sugar phosphate isomerase/epimerase [Tannerella sp.]|jgi:inosose dehydratase|nr:sugar phosphate isomerase/epimerase [Tannerella sp.]
MDRRTFIQNVAAGSLAAFAGLDAVSCSGSRVGNSRWKGKNLQWAMGWILWRDFRKRDIPLSEAINNLADLGLDGIEFSPRNDELSKHGFTRESFRELLNEKRLAVSGNYFGGAFHDKTKRDSILSSFGNTLDNLKFYGARNVIIGPPGRNVGNIPAAIRDSVPLLNELGRMAADVGVTLGVHPHVNTIIEKPDEIDMIMEWTDPRYVLMAPDTGHIRLGGGNVTEIVGKYRNRLSYFHLKDSAGVFNRPDFGPNLRELGKGEVDFPGVIKILKEVKYRGWLNVEQDYTTTTPFESATVSADYIHHVLKPIYS